jgi:polar amino acid transport system substrate-binding protein
MGSPRLNSWVVTIALLFTVPACMPALADNHSSSEDRVFRFNISPNGYPPYLINGEDGTSGIMWDVVKRITERLDYKLEAEAVPRKRVDQLLLEGMIDGTPRAKEWTDDPDAFIFTDSIVNIEEVVFFLRDSPHRFQTVEDLFSLTLVTHLGYHYPALEPHFESGSITRFDVPRDQDLFFYVLKGEDFHAAVADRLVGKWLQLFQNMQGQFRSSSASLSEYKFRIMLRPDWKPFADAFNRELASMRENGEITEILANYR